MKVIVATDSFKGSLDARSACEAIREGLLAALPRARVVVKPMADGGEGTAAALLSAFPGEWVPLQVMGPLEDQRADAGFAWFDKQGLALVEMAAASGLTLIPARLRNPLKTTTFGTGELLRAAAARSPKLILLGVGGSATVDGGVGAARALGWQFLDANGRSIGHGGGELGRIAKIVAPAQGNLPPVDVLCDVDNPLCGPDGAARVYAPQKGATPEMVERLESGLEHLARAVHAQLGRDIRDLPGAGAAGGLAAGAVAFMNASLTRGIEKILEVTRFRDDLRGADWVITGEGSFDHQSLRGKVVHGVARAAREAGVPVAVLAGAVRLKDEDYRPQGIRTARPLLAGGMTVEHAMAHARDLLREAARAWALDLPRT